MFLKSWDLTKRFLITKNCFYTRKILQITYISKLRTFVIEYANNFQDAKNNVFEDGDIFSIDLTEDQIIQEFREILIQYYL